MSYFSPAQPDIEVNYETVKTQIVSALQERLRKEMTRIGYSNSNNVYKITDHNMKTIQSQFQRPPQSFDRVGTQEVLKDLQDYMSLGVEHLGVQLEQFCHIIDTNTNHDNTKLTVSGLGESAITAAKESKKAGSRLPALAERAKKIKLQQQDILASQCLKQLPTFFRAEIDNIVASQQALSPKALSQVMKKLQLELVSISTEILTEKEIVAKTKTSLTAALQKEANTIQRNYLKNLQAIQTKVNRLVELHKNEYEFDTDTGESSFGSESEYDTDGNESLTAKFCQEILNDAKDENVATNTVEPLSRTRIVQKQMMQKIDVEANQEMSKLSLDKDTDLLLESVCLTDELIPIKLTDIKTIKTLPTGH